MIYTQNRELSWLKFNERVLAEAQGGEVPLFERLKFISIFTGNLDEFFMVRVGSLFDLSIDNEKNRDNKTGLTPSAQLKQIYAACKRLYKKRDEIYAQVSNELSRQGISRLSAAGLEAADAGFADEYFKGVVEPVLSPQVLDSRHPFPFIPNKQLNVLLRLEREGAALFGMIPVPITLPQVLYLPGEGLRYVHLSDIILARAHELFPGYTICSRCLFCVTRNADISPDDEDILDRGDDFRSVMKQLVRERRRLAVVRVETRGSLPEECRDMLCERLAVEPPQIFASKAPLALPYVFSLQSRIPSSLLPKLCYKPFSPVPTVSLPRDLSGGRDVLLSYPYESMKPFLELLRRAASDPAVLSIKITIYRLASNAKLVEYLCTAAENGKEVLVLIELRARFDEQNNIDWSERLERAGCRIIYGFERFKVHSKICLITRRDKSGLSYITQLGTGNYNEKTAELYTDLCLITENRAIGEDAAEFFKNMSIAELQGNYKQLLVAPYGLKSRLMQLVDEEIAKGVNGLIVMKVNSVSDLQMIEKLREASQAGVRVKLLVRGICCLLPGIPGYTDNIGIIGIVGRFLEHSRIYSFGEGKEQKLFISSADIMTRNMNRRVEIACPVYDKAAKEKINHLLELAFSDTVKARRIDSEGNYREIENSGVSIISQEVLMQEAQSAEIRPEGGGGILRSAMKRLITKAYERYVEGAEC